MVHTIVFTSINPFGRTEVQLECFRAWKRLGVTVRTLNSAKEIDPLLSLGLDKNDILEIDSSETASMFFGKPVPRISALFERAANDFKGQQLVIVNSDIYPAARNAGFIDSYLELAPAAALTREEVGSLNRPPARPGSPYRGGLDTFMFSAWAVPLMADRLAVWGSSERMAFGVPGWDYLVGSQIIDQAIGGIILDGSILLHVSHPQTYSNIDEFGHFISAMKTLGAVQADRVAEAAEEFATKINMLCKSRLSESQRVWACFYKPPKPKSLPSARAMELAQEFKQLVPWMAWNYSFSDLARVADERLEAESPDLNEACNFFCKHPHYPFQFSELLIAFLFEYACAHPSPRPLVCQYPVDNLHAPAVEHIIRQHDGEPYHRRMEIARLFCQELLYYDVFNKRLCDWLALNCENEDERILVSKVKSIWEEKNVGAA